MVYYPLRGISQWVNDIITTVVTVDETLLNPFVNNGEVIIPTLDVY